MEREQKGDVGGAERIESRRLTRGSTAEEDSIRAIVIASVDSSVEFGSVSATCMPRQEAGVSGRAVSWRARGPFLSAVGPGQMPVLLRFGGDSWALRA